MHFDFREALLRGSLANGGLLGLLFAHLLRVERNGLREAGKDCTTSFLQ